MADWFTAEQRWALIRRYKGGPKTPEEMAIEEACELSSEVRELWATRATWSAAQDDFPQLLWPKVFEVRSIMAIDVPIRRARLERRDAGGERLGGKRVPQVVRATLRDPRRVERVVPLAGAPGVEADMAASRGREQQR
jgi:hypothetical protein